MKEEEIIKKVLERVAPSKAEEKKIMGAVREIEKNISREAERRGLDVEVMLVGSIAKGTYLKNSLDVDIFMLFPSNYSKEEMREHSLEIGKKVLDDWKIQYAEHPYVRGRYGDYEVDIVPCYKIKKASEKMSSVDRTPFHTEYIRKNLKDKNEVRILKQFLKGIGCYGAEIKIQGFSGYLAELLIIKYGSFRKVLENSQKWKGKVVLSLNGEPEHDFPEKFVFIDPVDNSRNVAAAHSPKKLKFFIFAAGEYLKNPRMEFFFPREVVPLPVEKIKKSVENFVGICLPRPDLIDDILYSQIKKAAKNLEKILREYDFPVVESLYYVNGTVIIAAKLEKKKISGTKLHMGPPENEKEHVDAFLSKWKGNAVRGPFMEGGRWWVEIKREYVDACSLLKDKLGELNMGKDLNEMKDRAKICEDGELVNEDNAAFWTEYFMDKPPWER